jgi:Uma2 family endonuclease
MGLPPTRLISWADYVQLQESSPEKLEYHNGVIYNMTGGTLTHSRLQSRLILSLGTQLKGRPCEVLTSEMRMRIPASNTGLYPDASILCGEPELEDEGRTLLNPLVLIEVLSPSTADYDRGMKFAQYAQIVSFREYLLVDHTRPYIEQRVRADDGTWICYHGCAGDRLQLRSVPAELDIDALYAGLDLKGRRA